MVFIVRFSGMPYIARKMACSSRPSLEISKNEDEWTFTISSLFRTTISKFKLGEDYEEDMPGGKLKVRIPLNIFLLFNNKSDQHVPILTFLINSW